jgi:hypothetical protein
MFRVKTLYFREIAVNEIQTSAELGIKAKPLKKKLLLALESARTRLAVAIAEEKKCTLPDRWHHYLDMADQISCSIRKLRRMEIDESAAQEWSGALEELNRIRADEQAGQLCRILRKIIAAISV